MMQSQTLECSTCHRQLETFLAKRPITSKEECFCSEAHLDSYIANIGTKAVKKLKIPDDLDYRKKAEVYLEDVSSPEEAELMYFFYTLRGICKCTIVEKLISPDAIKLRIQELQQSQQTKLMQDLFFIRDIFRLAKNESMTQNIQAFVMQRIQMIFMDAKNSAQGIPDNAAFDREIYRMIIKNTVETLFELYSAENNGTYSRMLFEQPPATALHLMDLRDVPEQPVLALAIHEGPMKVYSVKVIHPDMITISRIEETVRAEELSIIDFIILEKKVKQHLTGFEVVEMRLLDPIIRASGLGELHVARNLNGIVRYDPKQHVTIHIHFNEKYFNQEMDFLFNISPSDQLSHVLERVSAELRRVLLPRKIADRKIILLQLKEQAKFEESLKSLFSSKNQSFRLLQIDISPSDIWFDRDQERTIYPEFELQLFESFRSEVILDRFLTDLAGLISKPLDELRGTLNSLLREDQINISQRLLENRYCRLIQLIERKRSIKDLHKFSFLFWYPNNGNLPGHDLVKRGLLPLSAVHKYTEELDNKHEGILENRHYFQKIDRAVEVLPPAGQLFVPLLRSTLISTEDPSEVNQNEIPPEMTQMGLPKILCLQLGGTTPGSITLSRALVKPAIVLNSRTLYELKTILQTEYEARTGAIGLIVSTKAGFESWLVSERAQLSLSKNRKNRSTLAIYELKVNWIGGGAA